MSGKPDTSASSGMQPYTPGEDTAESGQPQSFRLEALGGLETSASGGKQKNLPIQAIFLSLLVVAGAGVVILMRVMGLGAGFAFASVKTPDFKDTSATDAHIKLLEELQSSHVEAQVPPELVQKNPFKLVQETAADPGEAAPVDNSTALADKRAKERKQQVMSSIMRMQIHTILGGSNPIARVNDETVRVGDTLDEIFTVKAIEARHIVLECDGQEYKVSMDDEMDKQGGKRR